jgi:glycosyltransferase involved in cell wall biosynthesis
VEETYNYADTKVGLAGRANRVFGTAKRFQERVRSGDFDLVHINTSFDHKALLRDVVVVPRLHKRGPKIFLKFHGSDGDLLKTANPGLALLRRRLLSHADGFGVLSTEEQANFLVAGVPRRKLFVVKNIVERNSQKRDPEFLRRWKLPDDRPLLLFIGRFVPTKGLLDVITACGLLRDNRQPFLLLCLGDGPARSEAEALVQHLNLQPWVRFFGYIPEEQTAGFYAHSDMLLFPTFHIEGFPMVIFNAAAAGLPIITTRIRAAADYLTEPQNCLWVEAKSPRQLAKKIASVLEQPAMQDMMRFNNKILAENFSVETVTREYIETYRRME